MLKKGDRVKYVSGKYGEDRTLNPLWGGRYGKIAGTVVEIHGPYIHVLWDRGIRNVYLLNDLSLLKKSNKNHPLTTIFK